MTASQNVSQPASNCNSSVPPQEIPFSIAVPRCGVVTLSGYGIKISVNQGLLTFEDGVGSARRRVRCPRVGHGLRRLVVVGSDGMVSLAALRWLADQDASFVMLDRDGSVLVTTGPVRPSDARLRRAQALAQTSGVALEITQYLIAEKLTAQENLARTKLNDPNAADMISRWRKALPNSRSIEDARYMESQGASAYWAAYRHVEVRFPKQDTPRVPEHWRKFGVRQSPITRSPRLAVNPANALLNFLYALLEAEARMAAAALGLDPGLGFLHMDIAARDSLACDLMEPVRPKVDAYMLDLVNNHLLSRNWFFELGNGNCRLMPVITAMLSETSLQWSRLVAPYAEWVTRKLWTSPRSMVGRKTLPPTRLTHTRRYAAKGVAPPTPVEPKPQLPRGCENCGAPCTYNRRRCSKCAREDLHFEMIELAKHGRVLANTPEANAKRVEKQAKQWAARWAWKPEMQPAGLTAKFYSAEIQPRLVTITVPEIAAALSISEAYAADIRSGRHNPHPRHWRALAQMVDVLAIAQSLVTSSHEPRI